MDVRDYTVDRKDGVDAAYDWLEMRPHVPVALTKCFLCGLLAGTAITLLLVKLFY